MKIKSFLQALKLWAVWNLVTDIGLALALVAGGFPVVYIAVLDTGIEKALLMLGPISGLIGGLIIGWFQWLVFRNKINKAGRWIWATTFSWIIWVTTFSIVYWLLPRDTIFIVWLGVAAFVGGVIGYAQVKVLKTELPNTGWWVAANIVGWITTVLLEEAIANTGLGGVIDVPISFIIIGMVTGVAIVFLFDKTSYRSFNVMMLAGLSLTIILGMSLYVSQVYGQSKFTLRGHEDQVNAVAFSPDGSLLASAGKLDGSVKLWNASTGDEIRTLRNPGDGWDKSVYQFSFSPDGKLLVALLRDGIIKMWDIESGRELDNLERPRGAYRLKFSPDGRLVAAVGDKIITWDVTTGKSEIWTWHSGTNPDIPFPSDGQYRVESMDISSDGQYIVLSSQVNSEFIYIVDFNTKQVVSFFGEGYSKPLVKFTPDGRFIVSGSSEEPTLILWDVSNGERVQTYSSEIKGSIASGVRCIAISPDGTLLAVCLQNSPIIRLYDLATDQEIAALRGHSGEVNSVTFSPDGKYLASGSDDETVRLWDLAKIK